MKKAFSLFIIVLMVMFDLTAAAGITSLQPMGNTGGIPMNPVRIAGNKPYGPVYTVDKFQQIVDVNPWKDRRDSDYKGVPEWRYTDNEMIAVGGVKDIPVENHESMSLHVEAFCDNGFYFVSQSNPSYRRPFQLYVIPIAMRYYRRKASLSWYRYDTNAYGPALVLDSNHFALDINYNELVASNEMIDPDWYVYVNEYPRLWFDMVLVLPGEVDTDRNILTWDGVEYPLVEADDYSAVVTIKLQSNSNAGKSEEFNILVPFSGFYSKTQEEQKPDTVSMYVHPTAAAGNLDMRNYGLQEIASLEIMTATRDLKKENSYVVFISSSSDPYNNKESNTFKLRKENLAIDVDDTMYNSVGFKVVLYDKKNPSRQHVYKGNEALVGSCPLTKADLGNENNKSIIMMPEKAVDYTQSHAPEVRTFPFSGTAYIQIDNNSGTMMEAGRYTSSVYVHVVSIEK